MINKSILDSNILAKRTQTANESLLQKAMHSIIEEKKKKNPLPVTDEIMAWSPQTFLSNLENLMLFQKR